MRPIFKTSAKPYGHSNSLEYGNSVWTRLWKDRFTYFLLLPAISFTLLFAYVPMYGVIIAFKDFSFKGGIFHSPWAKDYGFYWFLKVFRDPEFLNALRNTIEISFTKLVLGTVACITLALLLNEVRSVIYKRTIQSIVYLPNFISWIILGGIVYNLLTSNGGVLNRMLSEVSGTERIQIIGNPAFFRAEIYVTMLWKTVGFGSIIYLAAIAGVSAELYEAAIIDGASRFQRVWFITLPCIRSTIVLLLILDMGSLMNAGFDQIYNLYSPMVYSVGDILDTLIYRRGVKSGQFSLTTAVGLFKNVVNLMLLLSVNFISKKLGEENTL